MHANLSSLKGPEGQGYVTAVLEAALKPFLATEA